jgi:hypothetical protein
MIFAARSAMLSAGGGNAMLAEYGIALGGSAAGGGAWGADMPRWMPAIAGDPAGLVIAGAVAAGLLLLLLFRR